MACGAADLVCKRTALHRIGIDDEHRHGGCGGRHGGACGPGCER
jgi:hypothetical protein